MYQALFFSPRGKEAKKQKKKKYLKKTPDLRLGIYWPPAQGGSGGGRRIFISRALRSRARALADVFEKNKKEK